MSTHRVAGGLGTALLSVLAAALLAAPAAAHVTVQPAEAPKGGFVKLTFRVPNESETAGTVKVEVRFPLDTPLAAVRIKPLAGWTADVETVRLPAPVRTDDGEVTEAVRSIVWTAQPGIRVGPGEFAEFEVSGGPLPNSTDQLVLPAAQTYDDGRVISWIDPPPAPGADEPEHPAPVLKLVDGTGDDGEGDGTEGDEASGAASSTAPGNGAATGTAGPAGSATSASDDTARWLGGAGLVLGALAAGLAGGTMLATRRRATAGVPGTTGTTGSTGTTGTTGTPAVPRTPEGDGEGHNGDAGRPS